MTADEKDVRARAIGEIVLAEWQRASDETAAVAESPAEGDEIMQAAYHHVAVAIWSRRGILTRSNPAGFAAATGNPN